MDPVRMQKMQSCIDEINALLNNLNQNKDEIAQCTGEEVVRPYREACGNMEKKLRGIRAKLQSLQFTGF